MFVFQSVHLSGIECDRNGRSLSDSFENEYLLILQNGHPLFRFKNAETGLWSASVDISGDTNAKSIALGVSPDGKVVASWLGEVNENRSTIYAAMLIDGTWSSPVSLTAPEEVMVNDGHGINVNTQGEVSAVWMGMIGSNPVTIRESHATFGTPNSWSTPGDL